MKLIYHDLNSNNEESPIDNEIISLSKGQTVFIVCPYLNLVYLKRIIDISKNWKLITDINEWVYSLNINQRKEIKKLLLNQKGKIKHISSLHAKVLITEKNAIIGSANLTESGILKKIEMSVLFNEVEKITELLDWFNILWEKGTILSGKKVEAIDNIKYVKPKKSTIINNIHNELIFQEARMKKIDNGFNYEDESDNYLIKGIQKLKNSRAWIESYFNLLDDLIKELHIEKNSHKISFSITNRFRISFIIGNRYIILPQKKAEIRVIMPLEFEKNISSYPEAELLGYFTKKGKREALYVSLKYDDEIAFDYTISKYLIQSAMDEWNRTEKSRFREKHSRKYFKAIIDKNYRQIILNKAYERIMV